MKWHTLHFLLPDFCLNNYTLLGTMKSTHIFSMLCHNTKICIRLFTCTEIFADTHAVETSFYSNVFFHYSKQASATYAQQKYLHGTEKKKFLQKNSKLKKKLPENILQ